MINLDHLEALAKGAPSGKWEVWTSNSWRRVMAPCVDRPGTMRVIEPVLQRHDNHPDLSFGPGVAEWLEGFTPEVALSLIAEVRALRETIRFQANAARAGMDAAKAAGAIMLQEALKVRAESSPDVLASERAVNAMLTEENEALREENMLCRAAIEEAVDLVRGWYTEESGESDSAAACYRVAQRQLSEAIGKACPRLFGEKPEGQKLYGLRWREMREENEALRKDKERLDSGRIVYVGWDDFGDRYEIDSRGNDLRAMIDKATAIAAKEKS